MPLYGAHELDRERAWLAGGPGRRREGPRRAGPARNPRRRHRDRRGGTPSDEVLRVLEGYDVVLWADADGPGRRHMQRIAARLTALGISRIASSIRGRTLTDGRDAADCAGTDEELRTLLATTRDVDPERVGRRGTALGGHLGGGALAVVRTAAVREARDPRGPS